MFNLEGKNALVTGATGDIGTAITKVLHAAGATVGLSGTREAILAERAGELGERCHILPCNLAEAASVTALVPAAEKAMGSLDILVNNAGITRDGLAVRMKDKDWEDVLAVNLSSSFKLARAALRAMMRQRHGRIISITSVVGATGNRGQTNYAASKAGIVGMSKALAHEVASRAITVNCVAPGFIETAMTAALTDKQKEAILATIPAGRLGHGDEVAASVLFLASDEAAYITGQTIHVNGGMAMI